MQCVKDAYEHSSRGMTTDPLEGHGSVAKSESRGSPNPVEVGGASQTAGSFVHSWSVG